MKLNRFIFPAPTSSYSANQLLGEILYIPREQYPLVRKDSYKKLKPVVNFEIDGEAMKKYSSESKLQEKAPALVKKAAAPPV
jgi:hypothetical protein